MDRSPSSPPAAEAVAGPVRGARREKLRLGELLLQQRLISEDVLQRTLADQPATGKRLGRLLIERGAIDDETLAHALARQLRVPVVNLNTYPLKSELVRLLPEVPARRHRALVLEERGDGLLVGFSDPLDLVACDDVARLLRCSIQIAVVPESQLVPAFDRHYRRTDEISGLARALQKDLGDAVDFGALQAAAGTEGAPVVRLLQTVFEDAVQIGASDVHLEPQEGELLIRNRVDGVLQLQTRADARIAAALTQRLNLMADLDIAEKRLPQDGRFSVRLRERTIEVRLSTLPCQYGESAVMRLLDAGSAIRRLDTLGLPPAMLARLRQLLARQSGVVLVTGPTGSGKTSTLYAALVEIDAQRHKIITVEDPVEYRLPGLTQVQVNERIELSFARVLRATLRQDPDVILVGEMRDPQTAEIGLRAAITGHLVLSTLHTRDAAGAPFRLLDMGIPPFMVATALQAVIAQRLVRLNCPHCARPEAPTPQQAGWLATMGRGDVVRPMRGAGCTACNSSGCAGRIGVYEMLEIDPALAHLAGQADPARFAALAGERLQGRTLAHRALDLVRDGRVPLDEAMRLAADADIDADVESVTD